MDLLAYPTSIPTGSLLTVIDLLRGKPVDKAKAFHIAWHLAGFGAGKFFPETEPIVPIGATLAHVTSNEDMAKTLEAAMAKQGSEENLVEAIPWPTLMPIFLQVLKMLLEMFAKKE